jgi:hypothetical protein
MPALPWLPSDFKPDAKATKELGQPQARKKHDPRLAMSSAVEKAMRARARKRRQ